MADRAHAVDEVLPASGARARSHASPPAHAANVSYRRAGRRRDLHVRTARSAKPKSPARSRAKLFVSSTTTDADFFLVFRVFTPDLREVVFMGAIDPHTPVAQGWLRASHRKLDTKLSTEYRPYHAHDEKQPLKPGEIVAARHRTVADLDRGAGAAIASR